MAAYSSAGRVPLVIWAAAVDPADVPTMRSASVRSTPASDRPAIRPSSHALPAAPPPARTRARWPESPACLVAPVCWPGIGQFPGRGVRVTVMSSEAVAGLTRGAGGGVVLMGVAFRGLPAGRSQLRLPQSRDRALQGAPITDTAHMGLTSLPMDHDHGDDRTPAMRCATLHLIWCWCSRRTSRTRIGRVTLQIAAPDPGSRTPLICRRDRALQGAA